MVSITFLVESGVVHLEFLLSRLSLSCVVHHEIGALELESELITCGRLYVHWRMTFTQQIGC